MSHSFSEIRTALDEIAKRLVQDRKRLELATTAIAQALADLQAVPQEYQALLQAMDTVAAANPDNTAYQTLKAEKDLLVAEGQELAATATVMKNALDALE